MTWFISKPTSAEDSDTPQRWRGRASGWVSVILTPFGYQLGL